MSPRFQDLLSPPDLQRLLRLCSTWLELQPCTAAEQRWAAAAQGLTLHGTATARHKRAAGVFENERILKREFCHI